MLFFFLIWMGGLNSMKDMTASTACTQNFPENIDVHVDEIDRHREPFANVWGIFALLYMRHRQNKLKFILKNILSSKDWKKAMVQEL